MGELLAFQQRKKVWRARRKPVATAEIILFPGVRYMRMDEPVERPKEPNQRAPRRRVRPGKKKVS